MSFHLVTSNLFIVSVGNWKHKKQIISKFVWTNYGNLWRSHTKTTKHFLAYWVGVRSKICSHRFVSSATQLRYGRCTKAWRNRSQECKEEALLQVNVVPYFFRRKLPLARRTPIIYINIQHICGLGPIKSYCITWIRGDITTW